MTLEQTETHYGELFSEWTAKEIVENLEPHTRRESLQALSDGGDFSLVTCGDGISVITHNGAETLVFADDEDVVDHKEDGFHYCTQSFAALRDLADSELAEGVQ